MTDCKSDEVLEWRLESSDDYLEFELTELDDDQRVHRSHGIQRVAGLELRTPRV